MNTIEQGAYDAVTPIDVFAAAKRIAAVVLRTPVRRSERLSEIAGVDVWLKLEAEQRTGSFKLRGAYNTLAMLSPEERARGVVAASAGNHGLGVAEAAQSLGIAATIFVPATAPRVKREGIQRRGATVNDAQANYDLAHAAAIEYAQRTRARYVDPCSGRALFAGAGTVALEIMTDLPSVGTIVTPVGGGGLLAGIADFVHAVSPSTRIIGVATEHTNAVKLSLDAGQVVPIPENLPTLADGLAGQADEGALELARRSLDDFVIVTEDELGRAMAWMTRQEGVRVEGAGAVGIAAILQQRASRLRAPVVVVVSGGNVDDARLQPLVDRYGN